MILLIVALVWGALLLPFMVRRSRENGTQRSIESFHEEHRRMSAKEHIVEPAFRLDPNDEYDRPYATGYPESTPAAQIPPVVYEDRRARLQVVQDDDTYRSLESRATWDDWNDNYDYDEVSVERAPVATANRYVAAYSAIPSQGVSAPYTQPRRRAMAARRRVIFSRLILATIVITALGLGTGFSPLVDLAVVTWILVAGYVALALLAVSQGYLKETSLGIRIPMRSSRLATIEPLDRYRAERFEPEYEDDEPMVLYHNELPATQYQQAGDGFVSEFYDPSSNGQWRRDSTAQYALG